MIELTGSWEKTITEAIQTVIKRADQTLRNMRSFEVVQTCRQVETGEVHYDQVVLKAGFTLKEEIHSAVRPAYPFRPGARC